MAPPSMHDESTLVTRISSLEAEVHSLKTLIQDGFSAILNQQNEMNKQSSDIGPSNHVMPTTYMTDCPSASSGGDLRHLQGATRRPFEEDEKNPSTRISTPVSDNRQHGGTKSTPQNRPQGGTKGGVGTAADGTPKGKALGAWRGGRGQERIEVL